MGDKLVPSTCCVKVLKYFIQFLKKNHVLFLFSKLFSSHHFLKSLNQLIVLFRVFDFPAASFNSVTSSRVTILNLNTILALIEITRAVAVAIFHFTSEIVN